LIYFMPLHFYKNVCWISTSLRIIFPGNSFFSFSNLAKKNSKKRRVALSI
jgi:hypothetical protein